MSQYWSQLTKRLSPYVPGEQPQDQQYIKLNTNENPFPPSPIALERMRAAIGDQLRLYPDPESRQLKEVLAKNYNVDYSNIFVGNGSDEVLAFAFMAFFTGLNCKEGKITFPDITYSFYPVYCDLLDIPYETFPLTECLEIDPTFIPPKSAGVIFPNPNAPTSLFLSVKYIETLLVSNPQCVIIVDEAYIDFGGESSIPLTKKYPNLLVIQTFSKSRALAGLRVGYAIGHHELIDGLCRVKNSVNSYPLDSIAHAGAIGAIQDDSYFVQKCQEVIRIRQWATAELKALQFYVLPSMANFLFIRSDHMDAGELYKLLKQSGILVRYFSTENLNQYLRISIGTEEEMRSLIVKIKVIVNLPK